MRNRPSLRCAELPAARRSSIECVVDWYRCCSLMLAPAVVVAVAAAAADDGADDVQVVRLSVTFVSCSVTVASS